MGAASISQATAPTNGGVTSEAITRVRTVRRSGMSVRATSQPSGAATMQQIALTETTMISVVISGSTKLGSVNRVTKLPSVGWPSLCEGVDDQPAHRQHDHHREQRGDGEQDGAREIELERGPPGLRCDDDLASAVRPHTLKIRAYFALISSASFSTSTGSSLKVLIATAAAGRPWP